MNISCGLDLASMFVHVVKYFVMEIQNRPKESEKSSKVEDCRNFIFQTSLNTQTIVFITFRSLKTQKSWMKFSFLSHFTHSLTRSSYTLLWILEYYEHCSEYEKLSFSSWGINMEQEYLQPILLIPITIFFV